MTDLKVRHEGATMVITFDRPEVLNAFRDQTYRELVTALEEAADDPAVRVVVLTGTGRAFSAGTDLKELAGHLGEESELLKERTKALQELTMLLTEHPKVIICAVNGLSVGIGVELALASDIRIAGESATFALKEVHRGFFPSNGVLYFLPRLVGHGRAVDLLLTGERIDAAQAYATGLVSRLVPDAELPGTTLAMAEQVAAAAPTPVRLIKQAMTQVWELDLPEVLAVEIEGLLACLNSTDMIEGVNAFAQKRAATFQGS
jgi:enoyl-CoA hydratase/carnithine racemase